MTSKVLRQSVSFQLSPDSGVPAYLQLAQQVKLALRMGILDVGDKLPSVKEVVAEVAVNPNTVVKAYGELEHEGLVEGRLRPYSSSWPEAWSAGCRRHAQKGSTTRPSSRCCTQRWLTCGWTKRMTTQGTPAICTNRLGKRYGSYWALQDCSVSVPPGHIAALVGPNGAGKTTLLKILTGLSAPSAGEAAVLGRAPQQSEEFLASIGYLAQDVPLYKRLSAADHLDMGAHLNRHWDAAGARARLTALGIPSERPVAKLSGGQQAQVALGLALAKRPQVLLLDEPMPALDPLARREFLSSLAEAGCRGRPLGRRLVTSAA